MNKICYTRTVVISATVFDTNALPLSRGTDVSVIPVAVEPVGFLSTGVTCMYTFDITFK